MYWPLPIHFAAFVFEEVGTFGRDIGYRLMKSARGILVPYNGVGLLKEEVDINCQVFSKALHLISLLALKPFN